MVQAVWRDAVLAEHEDVKVVKGIVFFPPKAINKAYFQVSSHTVTDPQKGEARYYSVNVDGQVNENAAFYFPDPKAEFAHLKNHVAFTNGVTVPGQKEAGQGCHCIIM